MFEFEEIYEDCEDEILEDYIFYEEVVTDNKGCLLIIIMGSLLTLILQ
jgi:hypothetical protein